MLISDLCRKIPGTVLHRRVVKDDIGPQKLILFLTAPAVLRGDVLYVASAEDAERFLPGCSAPNDSTVLCAGAVSAGLQCQVRINLLAVDCPLAELYNSAAAYLAECQQFTDIEAERLRRKFASVLEMNAADGHSTEDLCATFPKHIKSSYCMICIESHDAPGRTLRDYSMRKELQELFPEDNLTVYDNDTVIIHSYDGFTYPPKLPLTEFSALLKKYGALAGVSNGIRKVSSMRLMFVLAKKALESGKVLPERDQNVFFYDDTMLFSIVSLGAQSFEEKYGSDDIILLGNPILLALIKHDPDGKKKLVDTLIQYIIHGCSCTRTAEAMQTHRNTVRNRITVIEGILGTGFLQDGMLMSKLLVTYYIMEYYTGVMHKKMVLSPLQPEFDNPLPSGK